MPAPANDNFANAVAISTTAPGTITGITQFDATFEGSEQSGFNSDQSVWYKFTPTVTGRYRFNFDNFAYAGDGSVNSGQISIYLGGAAATSLATFTTANALSSDNYRTEAGWFATYGNGETSVQGVLTSGTTYYIRIGAYTGSGTNDGVITMDMEWEFLPPPANDDFDDAITLALDTPVTGTTRDSTLESGEPVEYTGGSLTAQSVWYKFTPAATRRYRFNLDMTDIPGVTGGKRGGIGVYSGAAVNALTRIGAHARGRGSTDGSAIDEGRKNGIEVALTSGTEYHIRVDCPDFTGDPEQIRTFDFTFEVKDVGTPSVPANDDIASATNLGSDPANGNYNLTTKGATFEGWENTSGYNQPSVWLKFTNTSAVTREFHLVSLAEGYTKPYYELYKLIGTDPVTAFAELDYIDSGTYGNFTDSTGNYDCASDGGHPLEAGATYYVYISDWNWYGNGYTEDYTFVLGTYVPPAPPDNDDVLSQSTYPYNNHFAHMGLSDWGNYYPNRHAGYRDGTTELATAQASEPSKAGFAATRSVWYLLELPFPPINASNPTGEGSYKIWVESAVDCVLAVYQDNGTNLSWHGFNGGPGTLLAEDDDSGAGNNPEVTLTTGDLGDCWVAVDSKTEGDFRILYQRITSGTPPANDDFADATVVSSIPFSVSGTTVNASAEPLETDSDSIGEGPKDTVWYKYVATKDGQLKIKCTCDSNNDDAYVFVDTFKGTTLENLVRHPDPPNYATGYFWHFDTPTEVDAQSVIINIVNGETYYIRVQTEAGGSEDFTIYVDDQIIYVNIQPSGADEMHGTLIDAAEIYVNIQLSSVEDFHLATNLDADTIYVNIQPTGVEFPAKAYTDTAVVSYNIQVDSHDCMTSWEPSQLYARIFDRFEGTANMRWIGTAVYDRFTVVAGDGLEEC